MKEDTKYRWMLAALVLVFIVATVWQGVENLYPPPTAVAPPELSAQRGDLQEAIQLLAKELEEQEKLREERMKELHQLAEKMNEEIEKLREDTRKVRSAIGDLRPDPPKE